MLEATSLPSRCHFTRNLRPGTSGAAPLGGEPSFGHGPRSTFAPTALVWIFLAFSSGCSNMVAPVVEASPLEDTRDMLGPYTVTARVLEHRGISKVRLFFRDASEERAKIVPMEETLPNRFEANIPGMLPGTRVHWFVEAEDMYGNMGYAPPSAEWGDDSCVEWASRQALQAPGSAYCFSVLPQ